MKTLQLLFMLSILFMSISCNDDNPETNNLVGTWVEKYPEMYDGISDTLIFTEDYYVEKNLHFQGWKYQQHGDTLIFYNSDKKFRFLFEFISPDEILFNDFLQNLGTTVAKPTYFQKIDSL